MEQEATVEPAERLVFEEVSAGQDGAMSLDQARRSGVSARQVWRRRATGRYQRCRRGVVVLGGVPPSWRQPIRIASIAAGEAAVVSHGSAVQVHGIEMPRSVHRRWKRDNAFIEVTAPIPRQVRLEGVRGHRSGALTEADIVDVDGMPVTSPVRTVIDLSSRLGVVGTGRLVDDFLRKKLITIDQLRTRVAMLRAAPGRSMKVLRAVIAMRSDASYRPGDSTLEARLRQVIKRKGFPAPTGQHWVRGRGFAVRLDFAYPEVKLYLEGDSFGWHSKASDLDRDNRRRNGLTERGWIGLHFTWRMTSTEIERSLAQMYDRTAKAWRLPR